MKKIIALVLALVTFVILCTGCVADTTDTSVDTDTADIKTTVSEAAEYTPIATPIPTVNVKNANVVVEETQTMWGSRNELLENVSQAFSKGLSFVELPNGEIEHGTLYMNLGDEYGLFVTESRKGYAYHLNDERVNVLLFENVDTEKGADILTITPKYTVIRDGESFKAVTIGEEWVLAEASDEFYLALTRGEMYERFDSYLFVYEQIAGVIATRLQKQSGNASFIELYGIQAGYYFASECTYYYITNNDLYAFNETLETYCVAKNVKVFRLIDYAVRAHLGVSEAPPMPYWETTDGECSNVTFKDVAEQYPLIWGNWK